MTLSLSWSNLGISRTSDSAPPVPCCCFWCSTIDLQSVLLETFLTFLWPVGVELNGPVSPPGMLLRRLWVPINYCVFLLERELV